MRLSITSTGIARLTALAFASLGLVFMSGASQPVTAADDTPTQVTLTVLSTGGSCGYTSNFALNVGGVAAGALDPPNDCTCDATSDSFSTSNPTVLAAVGGPSCVDLQVSMTGTAYVSWVRVDITRNSGVETFCMYDQNGGNCDVNNLCGAGYLWQTGSTWTQGPGDTDGDGLNNCVDPDLDGDSVANAVDNCPAVANPDQLDTNGNGVGDACEPNAVTVPWLGNPAQPHQVVSGQALILQGAALKGDGSPAAITSATWDPGDGGAVINVADVSNPYVLEASHVYTGADGTPYTAVLTIKYGSGQTDTDTFKVVVRNNSLDVRANMAIDRGLWYLYKTFSRTTIEGKPAGSWTDQGSASTASAIQAFEVNGHKQGGNPLEDPYVPVVKQGLRYILSTLATQNIGAQPLGNPDVNGDGKGLYSNWNSGTSVYISGQIVDALVASGTPNATADVGVATYVKNQTFKYIVENLMESYWYSQTDTNCGWCGGGGQGGWVYSLVTPNYGYGDNSASQWAAIGGLAAEDVWGISVPAFVKTENLKWLAFSQLTHGDPYYDGRFGYYNSTPIWTDGMSTTPSGLVQLIFDGVPSTDPRFTRAMSYMTKHWNSLIPNEPTLYGMYATTKAMRLAKPAPIAMLTDGTTSFDWYGGNFGGSGGKTGVGTWLVGNQAADGSWNYFGAGLGTAWGVLMLSPNLFQIGPTAACTVNPSEIGLHGGTVTFDGSGSFHEAPDRSIVSYSWSFDDGGATGSGVSASHGYGDAPGGVYPHTYNATLTVTDDQGLTGTVICPVKQVDDNVKPDANIGGDSPGEYALCVGETLTLDGSASSDPEGGALSYAWDWTAPLTFSPVNSTSATTTDATAHFTALGPGVYDIGLRVTDPEGKADSEFGHVTVKAATDPACNQPPNAQCQNVEVKIGPTCAAVSASVDAGTDDPDGNLTSVVQSPAGPYGLGSTVVTLTATDASGLTDSCTGIVSVVDGTPPTIQCDPAQTIECTGPNGANASVGATAADNCSVGPATCNPPSGTFPIGSTTVTCGATDGSGNTASCPTTVTVRDTTPPTIACPAPVVAECTGNSSAQVTPGAATAGDICGAVTVSGPASGLYPLGTTTVNYTATDAVGLQASCQAPITVRDTTPPAVPSCNAPATITPNQTPISFTATTTDTCSAVTVAVTGYNCTAVNGAGKVISKLDSCVVQWNGATLTVVDSGGVGDHITWTVVATDTSGNTSSATCEVDVINPGQGGGSKGNNGVGNGLDPQPPGNPPINDGPGTSPGNPGNKKK